MKGMITKTITVKGSVHRIFELWSNVENFPSFMNNIKSVHKTGDRTSHWVMEGPMGNDLEWEAQITAKEQDKLIAWNSIEGDIKTSGQVTFNQLPYNETEATVKLHYVPPAGKLGQLTAQFFDNPDRKLEEDLRRFKQFAETKI